MTILNKIVPNLRVDFEWESKILSYEWTIWITEFESCKGPWWPSSIVAVSGAGNPKIQGYRGSASKEFHHSTLLSVKVARFYYDTR